MIAYREHRGSLEDSLKTMQAFNTQEEMMAYIEEIEVDILDYLSGFKNELIPQYAELRIAIDDKSFYDERCGWNTQFVLSYGNCIGMCDLNYKE